MSESPKLTDKSNELELASSEIDPRILEVVRKEAELVSYAVVFIKKLIQVLCHPQNSCWSMKVPCQVWRQKFVMSFSRMVSMFENYKKLLLKLIKVIMNKIEKWRKD